ncbi:TIGR03943 family protein [Solirubrobacter ginsenosidimutans]|uniref:TIGR03943 family protein n=1 Tax=Solirubrobacter ginsenosidimutans TaxID=490573 RepID=A0A9X3MV76_9ACTN|nr:TIGR03943 family protein [Solirubrobacter ginsenosidimutans]MDA0163254.1 TIGR03943 family protein [Solirubrobacter ginsenosidimutans]
MNWDWTRVVRGLALATWGAFFAYLWISGRATTYIGPKTAWVVTLGALTLPLVAVAYLWGARSHPRAASAREVGANGLLIAPILLALMVPAPSLGALAVKNKRTKNPPAPIDAPVDGEIRLYEIAWAADSAKYAAANDLATGKAVDFVGFVSRDKLPGGQLELSRFFVSCCAADATAYSVKITPPAGEPPTPVDAWVRVRGTLAGQPGSTLSVAATALDKVSEPSNPYN